MIPYPIEIISGNEEARLIFMGVEHTQPERGRKLVIDIGGGSTELVIGEDFEPRSVESRRMGCVSFAGLFRRRYQRKTSSARPRRCRSWRRWPGSSVFRDGPWRWAPPAPLKPPEVLVAMGEKDGFITPERLEMLVNELLKHKNFDALSLPVSEDRKAVLRWASDPAVCLTRWPSKNFVCPMARCAKVSCTRWKAASATGYS